MRGLLSLTGAAAITALALIGCGPGNMMDAGVDGGGGMDVTMAGEGGADVRTDAGRDVRDAAVAVTFAPCAF